MLRISLPFIAHVLTPIDMLQTITEGQSMHDVAYLCFNAGQNIEILLGQSLYREHLKVSREQGINLKTVLDNYCRSVPDPQKLITAHEAWTIQSHGRQFKDVLVAELNVLPTFLVLEKEGYDLNALIENGHKLFPPATLAKCPEVAEDMREAGKALAFELSTACGFHVFRVTEAVLIRYWDHICGDEVRKKPKTIGGFATALQENKLGEEKIWETLKQLANLHRNPLIHPEAILTVEEAVETLGMARSAVGAMLRVMPDVLPTTSAQMVP